MLAGVLLSSACASGAAPAPRARGDVPAAAAPAEAAREAASQVRPRRPAWLVLPGGTRMAVDAVGVGANGQLAVPDDVRRAGWWRGSSRLGERFGSVVMAAHVDSFSQGRGPIAELLSAGAGDRLRVSGGGLAQVFTIESVTLVPRADLGERSGLFSVRGPLRLVLVTCGGPYDARRGYRDNVVIRASAGPP